MNVVVEHLKAIDAIARQPVPASVLMRAKESLLDYIGVTYAGIESQREALEMFSTMLSGESGCGLALGLGGHFTLKDAVFLNGLNAHALDFDDGVNAGIIHLGSPIFSLLLPLASKYETSGNRLLSSAVIGYESAWTLAYSIQPEHKLRGFHATCTCGMLGAIIAASYLLNYSAEERFRAFSVGCITAQGTLKVLEDGSQLKPYNVAKASLLALVSLQMAKAGYEVPDDAMSGDRGFLNLMTGNNASKLLQPLVDGKFAIMRTYTKPYAACRYCHPSIEAAIELGERLGHDSSLVSTIDVETYELAVNKHDHTKIKGRGSAKMSIPYGVAVGFLYGNAGLAEYADETLEDASVLDLCAKVRVKSNAGFTASFPQATTAEVTLVSLNGSKNTVRIDYPKGEPENPLGYEGVCRKFCEMTSFSGRNADWQRKVIDAVFHVEDDLPCLISLIKEA